MESDAIYHRIQHYQSGNQWYRNFLYLQENFQCPAQFSEQIIEKGI